MQNRLVAIAMLTLLGCKDDPAPAPAPTAAAAPPPSVEAQPINPGKLRVDMSRMQPLRPMVAPGAALIGPAGNVGSDAAAASATASAASAPSASASR
jgi:hypothetical protein